MRELGKFGEGVCREPGINRVGLLSRGGSAYSAARRDRRRTCRSIKYDLNSSSQLVGMGETHVTGQACSPSAAPSSAAFKRVRTSRSERFGSR